MLTEEAEELMLSSLDSEDETFYRKLFQSMSQNLEKLRQSIADFEPTLERRREYDENLERQLEALTETKARKNEAQKIYDQLTD